MKIRIVTLHQPWATLLAAGILKKNETRPKAANYDPDDIVLIHAAVKSPRWQVDYKYRHEVEEVVSHLIDLGYNRSVSDLPSGAIVGEFKVKKCVRSIGPMKKEDSLFPVVEGAVYLSDESYVQGTELFLGNYEKGRSIWIGTDHRLLKEPYPYKNGQGYYQKFKGDYNDLKF